MRGILILIGSGLLALVIFFVFFRAEPATPEIEVQAVTIKSPSRKVPEKPVATADQAGLPDGRYDRVVGKDLIAVPEFEPEELERLPARDPLSKPPERKDDTGTKLLHRPVAVAAGIIDAGGHRIRLAGIEALSPDTMCATLVGNLRPCGRQALTAFRAWLRGRSIECNLGEPANDGIVETACRLGGKDAAAWLVEQGWAKAEATSSYVMLEADARKHFRGIFRIED